MSLPAFPVEIWREVLRIAVQIPGSLETNSTDFMLWHGLQSTWYSSWYYEHSDRFQDYRSGLRTKLSIVQVSRTWREIGVELLYEYLVFSYEDTECKAMATIATIFERHSNEPGYGWATKHIDVPVDVLSPCTLPILMRLLSSCHNLRILSINRDSTDALDQEILPRNTPSLSELSLLLQSRFSHSLRRMAFNLEDADIEGENGGPPAPFQLHHYLPDIPLDSLEILTSFLPSDEPYAITTVSNLTINMWYCLPMGMHLGHFPSLRHLHLVDFFDEAVPSLLRFLALHGPQLVSLAVSPDRQAVRLPELVRPAANLRCLVFDLLHASSFSYASPFLTITDIGIRSVSSRIPRDFDSSLFFPRSIFPNLQRLRFLDISDDRPSWLLDIAPNFSPIRVENNSCQPIL